MELISKNIRDVNCIKIFDEFLENEVLSMCGEDSRRMRVMSCMLSAACMCGAHVLVSHLLDRGCSVSMSGVDWPGVSPLEIACVHGTVEVVKILISRGADTRGVRPDVLVYVMRYDRDTFRLLLDNGIDLDALLDAWPKMDEFSKTCRVDFLGCWREDATILAISQMVGLNEDSVFHYLGVCLYDIAKLISPPPDI